MITEQFDSVKLLHMLGDEFKLLNLPFKVKVVERAQSPMDFASSGMSYIVIEITTECSEEEKFYFSKFGREEQVAREPMIDFNELRAATNEYFESEQDAMNFSMGLDIQYKQRYVYSIKIGLEEAQVMSFIDDFRDVTEPLRQKVYEKNFDKEVEDHLSNDEYNKDNGHK